jgi:hypothetical protein
MDGVIFVATSGLALASGFVLGVLLYIWRHPSKYVAITIKSGEKRGQRPHR